MLLVLTFVIVKASTLYLLNIGTAWQELGNNKLRTFLSLLGVSIGVFCIVGVYTMVDSLKRNIQNSLDTLGNDVLYINKFAWMPEEGEKEYPFWKYKSRPNAKLAEVNFLQQNIPAIGYAAILHNDYQTAQFNGNELGVNISAVNYDYVHLQNLEFTQGRYFSVAEMQSNSYGIIIGKNIAEKFFPNLQPIGKTIKLYNRFFTVIGVLKKRGQEIGGGNLDDGAIVSYHCLKSFQNIEDDSQEMQDNTLMLKPRGKYPVMDLKYEVKGALRALRKIAPGKEDNFSFNLLSNIQMQVESIFAIVNGVGFCIGILSLLVGAFGIANIMFVIVKERTPQIGLKKAIGAKSASILIEFLIEAILLCLLGGLIGIGLVSLLAALVNKFADFPVSLRANNFIVGIVISLLVGVLSGLLPARQASRLNPVAAIRS